MEKSGLRLCREVVVLSAGNGGRKRKVEVGGRDCPSAAGKFGACSVRDCEDFLCFSDVSAVARDDQVAVAEDDVSVTEEEVGENGINCKGGRRWTRRAG